MGKSKNEKLKDKRGKLAAKGKKLAEKIGKRTSAAALLLSACCLYGCATSEPASRVTRSEYGDITIRLENSSSNVVSITIGDGAYASADSKGSTETTTANPSNTVSPTTNFTYGLNSATAGGTDWISQLTSASAQGLASWLKSGNANGTMTVTKTDGTTETVTCKDGSCTTAGGDCITCGSCSTCSD